MHFFILIFLKICRIFLNSAKRKTQTKILSKAKTLFSLSPHETNEKIILKLINDITVSLQNTTPFPEKNLTVANTIFSILFGLLKTPYAALWKPTISALKKLSSQKSIFFSAETVFSTLNSSFLSVFAKPNVKFNPEFSQKFSQKPISDILTLFKASKECNKQCRAVSLTENCLALLEAVPSLAQKNLKPFLTAVLANFMSENSQTAENGNFCDWKRFSSYWSDEAMEEFFVYTERRESVINLIGAFIGVLSKLKGLERCREESVFVKRLVRMFFFNFFLFRLNF